MTKITGKSLAKASQMAGLLEKNNPNPNIKISILNLAKLFIQEGEIENIRGDIAFAQAMKETGWLKYGGQVLPQQNNYCGLGATNNSPVGKGAWFDTELQGVRAQIQHLKAYANKEPLNTPCIDPRFKLVTRGVAPNWENLDGKWAVPGVGYGKSILSIYDNILKIDSDEIHQENKEIEELRLEITKIYKELKSIKSQTKNHDSIINKLKKIFN